MAVSTTLCDRNCTRTKQAKYASFLAETAVPSAAMATNEEIRQQVSQLVDSLGITQKKLAEKMGITESWLSRWLNEKREGLVLDVDAMDRFVAYQTELAELFEQIKETQRTAGAISARHRFSADRRKADQGPPSKHDRRAR